MKLKNLLLLGALAAGAAYLYKQYKHPTVACSVGVIGGRKAKPQRELMFATGNLHKAAEMERMLAPIGCRVLPVELDVEETGKSFAENALLKARAVYALTGCPVIADDSGLCIDALNGQPGIYSARYGGEGATSHDKNLKVLREMAGVEDRAARFVCAIAYLDQDGDEHLFVGECRGEIGFEERGGKGFGYDPIFMLGERSIAELEAAEKDAVSHRGAAVRKLMAYLKEH
jgi:XTP/dITP diphosphohydrolase